MNWQDAVEKTVTGLGYDLVDCERSPAGLLRVYIDRLPELAAAGELINVEDCERVTRQLQYVLEVEECPYERLEVSSPGLDRPLKKAADYARFVGQEVEITLRMPFQGRKKYKGLLALLPEVAVPADAAQAAPEWRLIISEGGADQALDFSLEEVREARLVPVVNFKGRGSKPAPAKKGGGEEVVRINDKVDGGPDQ
jgi:ribosome maturation factor RimP